MPAQQEVLIGEDELNELMAQLETETAGAVTPPPAVVKTVAPEDDPLAGLNEDPRDGLEGLDETSVATSRNDTEHLLSTPENAAHLERSIAQANAGAVTARELIEPNLEDELASLDAELGAARTVQITNAAGETNTMSLPAAGAPSLADKIAAVAAKAKETHPSDVPKAAVIENTSSPLTPEIEAQMKTDMEKRGLTSTIAPSDPNKALDEELAAIAATMPPATTVPTPAPIERVNPNPPPIEATPAPAPKPAGLNFHIDVDQFKRSISVSETNLDTRMMEQAGDYAYYAQQSALAEAQHLRLKARFSVLEATLYDQHRKDLIAKAALDSSFKVTEKAVENAVKIDPKWLKNYNVVIEAESIAAIAKGCSESLKQRRDMIIQLGADRREEGKGQARIVAGAMAHDDMKSRAAELAKRS